MAGLVRQSHFFLEKVSKRLINQLNRLRKAPKTVQPKERSTRPTRISSALRTVPTNSVAVTVSPVFFGKKAGKRLIDTLQPVRITPNKSKRNKNSHIHIDNEKKTLPSSTVLETVFSSSSWKPPKKSAMASINCTRLSTRHCHSSSSSSSSLVVSAPV